MFKKNKRIVSKETLENISQLPCIICKSRPLNDPHHMTTRGAGGGDTTANVIPLCRKHHTEIHKIGRTTFIDKYDVLVKWCQEMMREDLLD